MTDKMPSPIVVFDCDEASYLGDERDGVYYQVAEGPGGWFLTVVVDCDTASFIQTTTADDGPYASEAEALEAGKGAAIEWCANNNVEWEEP